MKFNILTYNNGVGIVTDAFLLREIIEKYVTVNVNLQFINESNISESDIGVWIQNFDINFLNRFKKNIFFINEEWAGYNELNNLHLFDYVICKSNYAKKLLEKFSSNKNILHLPFISKNYFDEQIIKNDNFLHFVGKSIQKNTELVLQQQIPITLIDSNARFNPDKNFNHIKTYQTNEQIHYLLNRHKVHICCSLYESWGHYLFEGLSTGSEILCSDIPVFREQLDPNLIHFIPTEEKVVDNYLYCSGNKNNIFPLRKAFFVDILKFKNSIENFSPIGKNKDRVELFKSINKNGQEKLTNFLNNI